MTSARIVYSIAVTLSDGRIIVPSRAIRLSDCEPPQCEIGDALPIDRLVTMPDSVMWHVPLDDDSGCAIFKRTPYMPEPTSKIEANKVIWGWERMA